MYPVGQSLGAAPSWCPPTSYSRDDPPDDPCAITYNIDLGFDTPFGFFGKEDIRIPINQIVNDIRLQLQRDLPEIMDNVWVASQPYINDIIVQIEDEVRYLTPVVAEDVMRSVVLPEIGNQLEATFGRARALEKEALKVMIGVGGALILSVGLAAWWIKKG